MSAVKLHAGGPRSARAQHLERLLADNWGRARLVVPTRSSARMRLERMLRAHRLPGCLHSPIIDFKSFTEQILTRSGETPRMAGDLRRRLALDGVLEEMADAGRLAAFPEESRGAGLVSHLLAIITQLKQAAIEPHGFRRALEIIGEATVLDEVAASAYEGYQEAMIAAGLYDVPGLYWRAHDIAVAGRPRALEGVEVLIFDGFDDFTPSEFRLVTALAPHVAQLHFGLALDLQSDRRDVYHLAASAAERIQTAFNAAIVEHESAPCATLANYAADHAFWRSAPQPPGELESNLRIVRCIDPIHEAETLARRARALVLSGTPPDRIAIVYRNLSSAAPWLRAAFAEYALPAHIGHAAPLSATAAGAFLASVLHATATWEREGIAEVIASPLFAPSTGSSAQRMAAGSIARRALILEGQFEWRTRLEQYAARVERKDLREAETARALLDAVTVLDEATRVFDKDAALSARCEAADALLDALGLENALAALPHGAEEELAALGALRGLLAELANAGNAEMARADFVALLDQALRDTTGPKCGPRAGVQCLDVLNARHLDFDHVFFGGLNEGAMPQLSGTNAIYNEAARARLRAAGIALEGREERAAREMAAYHHILALPRKSLVLSYRLNEGGREAAPSPFLVQTMDLFEKTRTDVQEPPPLADAFIPSLDAAASLRETRNAAFALGVKSAEDAFPEAARGASIERDRYVDRNFTAYDAVLAQAAAAKIIGQRFGADHEFSVSQLEAYARCPFEFYVRRVLRVDEDDAPEAELGHLLRGEIMHRVLQLFHERYRGMPTCAIPEEGAALAMRELVEQVFDERAWKAKAAPEGVIAAERLRMERLLARYLARAREKQDDTWLPTYFEQAFGAARGDAAETPQPSAFELQTAAGTVKFSGRIDRIDESGNSLRIVDYKTGGMPSAAQISEGISLQLAVYSLACEQHLFPGKTCDEAMYVRVGGAKEQQALTGRGTDKPTIQGRAVEEIARCLDALRAGVFIPFPRVQVCHGCTMAHICRHETARIARKTPPPALGLTVPAADEEDATE